MPRRRSIALLGNICYLSVMSEATEQAKVVRRLRDAGIRFCHVPNGLETSARATMHLARQGVIPGVPDLLIFTKPPNRPEAVGVALEMKTEKFSDSQLRRSQREWLDDLETLGWVSLIGKGSADAVTQLRDLGYPI
jgi:hypothetical protein